jgi:hypothetical protein
MPPSWGPGALVWEAGLPKVQEPQEELARIDSIADLELRPMAIA